MKDAHPFLNSSPRHYTTPKAAPGVRYSAFFAFSILVKFIEALEVFTTSFSLIRHSHEAKLRPFYLPWGFAVFWLCTANIG
jgi:hypothetical protein